MSKSSIVSAQARGKIHVQRLKSWLRDTPKAEIPLNQFGRVAREPVCRKLKISPSTVQSNAALKAVFDGYDLNLQSSPKGSEAAVHIAGKVTPPTDPSISALKQYAQENHSLRAKLNRLQYLEDTGVWLQAP